MMIAYIWILSYDDNDAMYMYFWNLFELLIIKMKCIHADVDLDILRIAL
jgi:hypothetical protein